MQVQIDNDMQSSNGDQILCPGQSLWSLIVEHVPRPELPKIQKALGQSLVDMYTEVHNEAVIWHKIWLDSQTGGVYNRRAEAPLQQQTRLADPPAIKELVTAGVRMLLENLIVKGSREGRHKKELLQHYKLETLNFVLECPDTNADNKSRLSYHSPVKSKIEDRFEGVKSKLNATDIQQVVDHVRSVLAEECETLKKLVKQIQDHIQKSYTSVSECGKTEPTLAELRELREQIQADLELYSSFSSSPACFPAKTMKKTFRTSDSTLQTSTAMHVRRPHSYSAMYHLKPKPPSGPPLCNCGSPRAENELTSQRIYDEHGSSTSTRPPSKLQTTMCRKNITSRHKAVRPSSGHDQGEPSDYCNDTKEKDNTILHCRPSFQIKTQRYSCIRVAHPSSHCSIYSLSRECDLSSQTERNSTLAPRSKNSNIIPSPIQTLSSTCDAGNYNCSYSGHVTGHCVSTTGKSTAQKELQDCSCDNSSVSTTVQTDHTTKKNLLSQHSVMSLTERHIALNNYRRSKIEIN